MRKLAKQAFTILVAALLFVPIVIADVNTDPVFNGPAIVGPTTEEDTAKELDLTGLFTDADSDPLTYALIKSDDTVPTEVMMSVASSKATFTPKANWNGALNVYIKASDGKGGIPAESNEFTITVNAVNDAPVLSTTDKEAYVGKDFVYEFIAKNVDVDTDADLNKGLVVPESLKFALSDKADLDELAIEETTGKITIKPTSSQTKLYEDITVNVEDLAGKKSEAKFDLTIHPEMWQKDEKTGDLKISYEIADESDLDSLKISDKISVDVTVENGNAKDEVNDVVAEVALWDLTEGDEVAVETSSKYDLKKKGDTDNGDEFTDTIELEIPSDAKDDNLYILYIYSYESGNEDSQYTRARNYESVDVDIASNEVLLKSLVLPEEEVNAGDAVAMTVEVHNIGKNKEERIKLVVEDLDSGEKEITVFEDLSSGKKATKPIQLTVADSAYSGTHTIKVTAYYKYDDKDNTYDETSSPISGTITVVGKGDVGALTLGKSSINTGETKEVALTIKNNQGVSKKYTVEVDGTSGWADYVVSPSVSDRSMAAGASFESKLTITPKTDAAPGEYKVSVSVKSGSFEVDSEDLTVTVGASGGLITGGATGLPPYKSWESLGDEMLISATIIGVCIVLAGLGYGYFKGKAGSSKEL